MDPRIAPSTYNPFSEAMDHAQKNMSLSLQRDQLAQQQQQLDMAKEEHQINMGMKIGEGLQKVVTTGHPKVRSVWADQLDESVKKINGKGLDPGLLADLKSNEPSEQLVNGLAGAFNPDLPWDKRTGYFKAIAQNASEQEFYTVLGKASEESAKLKQTQMTTDATVAAAKARGAITANNLDYRQTKDAQKEFDSVTKDTQFRLQGASRLDGLIKAAEDGKIKTTGELWAQLNNELTRMEQGTNVIADAARKRMLMESFEQSFKEFKQKATAHPEEAISKPLMDQFKGTMNEMRTSYMSQFDTQIKTLSAGATPTQQKTFEQKSNALRADYHKKWGWPGYVDPSEKNKPDESDATGGGGPITPAPPAGKSAAKGGAPEISLVAMTPTQRNTFMTKIKALKEAGVSRADVEKSLGKKIPDAIASSIFQGE